MGVIRFRQGDKWGVGVGATMELVLFQEEDELSLCCVRPQPTVSKHR